MENQPAATTAEPRKPRKAARRFIAWVLVVLGCLLALALLVWAAYGADQRPELPLIWLCAAPITLLLGAMAWLLATTPAAAIRVPQWLGALVILLVAVAARLAILYSWTPTLSDDIFRYRFDGRLVAAGIEPYRYLPTDQPVPHDAQINTAYARKPPIQPDLLDRMSNNAFVPTLYFPVSEFVLGAAAWWEHGLTGGKAYMPQVKLPWRGSPAWRKLKVALLKNPRLFPYRAVHVIADILVVGVLLVMLWQMGRSVWWAALYAWNPLPLIEVAGNGHLESVGVLLLLLGVLALRKRWWLAASILLALALMVKPWALFAVPLACAWYWQCRVDVPAKQRRRALAKLAAVYAATVLACLLPFVRGWPALAKTMAIYAANWSFNGFFYMVLRYLVFLGAGNWARVPLNLLFVLFVAWLTREAYRRNLSPERTVGHLLLVFLLFSPQVYPWYVLWPLAFVPLVWNPASFVLAYSVLLSYQVWFVYINSQGWRLHWWLFLVEWLPVVVLECIQLRADLRHAPPAARLSTAGPATLPGGTLSPGAA